MKMLATCRRVLAVLALLSAAATISAPARADLVQLGAAPGTEYFHAGVLVRPASFDVNEFVSTVAGTVTLSINRIDWGDLFSQLTTTVSLANRPDLQFSGNAQAAFDVTAGESFATSIYAQLGGTLGYGAYRLDVLFLPKVSQVPLPGSVLLLLSGCGALLVLGRRRRASTPQLV